MHHMLHHQLKKLGLSSTEMPSLSRWEAFLHRVEASYEIAEQDRYELERSIAASSSEMLTLHKQHKLTIEGQLTAILNTLPDQLYVIDESGQYLQVLSNSNPYAIHNADLELIGSMLGDVHTKKNATVLIAAINHALDGLELQLLHYDVETDTGLRHIEGRIMPTGSKTDDKRTVVFLARDITEQRVAQQQQQLLSTVLFSASEAVVIIDKSRKVLYANPAIETITSYSPKELMSDGYGFLRHKLDKNLCEDICKTSRENDRQQREIVIHKKNNEEVNVMLNLNTLRDATGEIEHLVAILTDITELKNSKNQLEYIANHDDLTHLPNRFLFEQRMKTAIPRATRNKKEGALLLLDLDHFKDVYGSFGHHVGDLLLAQVATRLIESCRTEDTIARLGGDTFVIVLEDISNELQVYQTAKKILRTFDQVFNIEEEELNVTCSIGIAFFPQNGNTTKQLLHRADIAMKAAKDAGHNRYYLYSNCPSGDTGNDVFARENDLINALKKDEFLIFFQPQFALPNQQLSGFEVLIRWNHPKRGLILPAEFIPLAEATGLIHDIGLWVFKQICERLVDWSEKKLPFGKICFNVSQRQLIENNMASKYLSILKSYDAEKYTPCLECEITESTIATHADSAYDNLYALHNDGFSLSLDDFGTGNSSILSLKQFPFDRLKIDRSFTKDIGKGGNDEDIVKAIIALANSFDIKVIASGVENETQEAFLMDVHCHHIQGDYYHKPMTIIEAETLLQMALDEQQSDQ